MSEADYRRITYEYTIATAKVLARPTMTFIFVSGAGAQRDTMWARVKRTTGFNHLRTERHSLPHQDRILTA
jgi:hypothetical protein